MDIFYDLPRPTVKKVKNIFTWSYKNGLKTDVDMLNCSVSFCRKKSDKAFEEVLEHIDKKSIHYFRVINRIQINVFGILTDHYERRDLLEIFIRGIDIGNVEYFIFSYMDTINLKILDNKYHMSKLT